MNDFEVSGLCRRVRALERRLRLTSALLIALPLLLVLGAGTDQDREILRARGLVLVDEEGRDRILIGAPVAPAGSRKRDDPMTGMVILNETGEDRIAIGAPVPDPQIGGRVSRRISPAAGIQFNDLEGNERGGFGFMDNGRIVLGMDRESGEGLMLFVMPPEEMGGISGLLLNGDQGPNRQRIFLGMGEGETNIGLSLSDPAGQRRSWYRLGPDGTPQLDVWDGQGELLFDLIDKDGQR